MKYLTLILVTSIFLCYTETGSLAQQILLQDSGNSHHCGVQNENHTHAISDTNNHDHNTHNVNKIGKHEKHKNSEKEHITDCCLDSFFNANSFKLKLTKNYAYTSLKYDFFVLKIDKFSNYAFPSDKVKRKRRPPEIFLVNSTFLI